VLRLILAFVDIAFHRRGPDYLPSSQFFFLLVLIASLVIGMGALLVNQPLARSLAVTVVTTVLDFAFFWAVLKSFSRERRFVQTMTALLGTNAFLNLLIVPLAFWGRAARVAEQDAVLPWLLVFLLSVWWVDIAGFVLARAVDRPYPFGVALVLGYVMFSLSLQATLFPAPTA
jgi:hypothetical protein